ncbi:hypothetical protein B0G57_10891 [Trinickia symbiotica]|uniref:Uncharacterized protein n=1 Tax=Trinickia symbiotica TaxID=863227 RepID=A0A2N7X279_9BURK|nr:hypothetical protein [Trinickia symbiotica]PMS35846.1 hypothetical protein C0Z20_16090 [Trinickia symbiotica]PPK44511.1 hypothetical protein B0G57_10891 [Trinickia symbiotica]
MEMTSNAESISPWRVFVAVLAAPAAWTMQVAIAEALVAQSCFPYDAPMRASYADAALRAVIGVSAAALLVGIAGTYFCWRYWRRLAAKSPGEKGGQQGSRPNGETFVARVGFMSSVVFLFALVATDIATGLISSCG